MPTCNENKDTFFSIFAPEPMPADAIADAFAQLSQERRPLAAYLFTNLVRLTVMPEEGLSDAEEDGLIRRQLEECRKVSAELEPVAAKAVLPRFDFKRYEALMLSLTASETKEDFAKSMPAVGVLLSLVGLLEKVMKAECMQLLEALADREDRDGARTVIFAAILKKMYSVESMPKEKYDAVGRAMAAEFRKVLSDDEMRRFSHFAEALSRITGSHNVTRLLPTVRDSRLSQRDAVNYVLFVGLTCRAILPQELFESERYAADVLGDVAFFLDEPAADAFVQKIADFVVTVTTPERDLWLEAYLTEAAMIQTMLGLPEADLETYVGKADDKDTAEDKALLNLFVRLGQKIAGCDDLAGFLSMPKASLN